MKTILTCSRSSCTFISTGDFFGPFPSLMIVVAVVVVVVVAVVVVGTMEVSVVVVGTMELRVVVVFMRDTDVSNRGRDNGTDVAFGVVVVDDTGLPLPSDGPLSEG